MSDEDLLVFFIVSTGFDMSRNDSKDRLLFEEPLVVTFDIDDSDMTVAGMLNRLDESEPSSGIVFVERGRSMLL